MPLQNRVTPFGEILAIPQRGLFLGNRGIIHDPATKTLLKKRWSLKAWIICLCSYKGKHREPMAQRSWTELFFLDEATALAAGHRPCFYCRRRAAEEFRACWARGHGCDLPSAPEMDKLLHQQRLDGKTKRLHPLLGKPLDLPTGAMLSAGARSYLIAKGKSYLWSPDGYVKEALPQQIDGLLTPPASLHVLSAGYDVTLHPSIVGRSL